MTGVGLEPTTNGLTYLRSFAGRCYSSKSCVNQGRGLPTICPPTLVRPTLNWPLLSRFGTNSPRRSGRLSWRWSGPLRGPRDETTRKQRGATIQVDPGGRAGPCRCDPWWPVAGGGRPCRWDRPDHFGSLVARGAGGRPALSAPCRRIAPSAAKRLGPMPGTLAVRLKPGPPFWWRSFSASRRPSSGNNT